MADMLFFFFWHCWQFDHFWAMGG